MKQIFAIFLIAAMLVSFCACGREVASEATSNSTVSEPEPVISEPPEPESEPTAPLDTQTVENSTESSGHLTTSDLLGYVGFYETDTGDSAINIYGVTDDREVIYDIFWYRMASMGGVTQAESSTLPISTSPAAGMSISGQLDFKNGTLLLTVTSSDCMVATGEYLYSFSGETYKDTTVCGNGSTEHELFLQYIENKFDGLYNDWYYCGQSCDIFCRPGEEWAEPTDIYCLELSGAREYFVVMQTADYSGCELYHVESDGALRFIMQSNGQPSSYTSDPGYDIPHVDAYIDMLGMDLTTLQNSIDYPLTGPMASTQRHCATSFGLQNIGSAACYMDDPWGDAHVYYGLENNALIFYGMSNTASSMVRDCLTPETRNIEPAVFTFGDRGHVAYVWEYNNGYQAVVAFPWSESWLNNPTYSVLYVSDLTYLSYIS